MPATETSAGVTFLFTVIGVVTAVVWVDVVQMLLYVTGGLIAIVLIASSIGTSWLGEAAEAGRTQLFVWSGNPLSADDSFLVSGRTWRDPATGVTASVLANDSEGAWPVLEADADARIREEDTTRKRFFDERPRIERAHTRVPRVPVPQLIVCTVTRRDAPTRNLCIELRLESNFQGVIIQA